MTGTGKEPTKAGWELYDLKNDPHELKNVYNDPRYSSVIQKLKQELANLKNEFGDTDEKFPELMKLRSQDL